jgi:hypothetical protein
MRGYRSQNKSSVNDGIYVGPTAGREIVQSARRYRFHNKKRDSSGNEEGNTTEREIVQSMRGYRVPQQEEG